LLLLAPLLGPGFVLAFDMVFVPDLPLSDRLLGLDGVPRAVPSDLIVALASLVVPGGWLQDLILAGTVVGAAWGAARLVPTTRPVVAVVAATTYGWSAYLHERLLLGQWALLVGWAVLPWAAKAALEWRRGGPAAPVVLFLAVGACGGASSGLLVGLVVVVCGHPFRGLLATGVLSLPWAVPALLAPGGYGGGDPAGVAAFASRSDTPFGVVLSLLTGGGIWAPAAVPPGRSASSSAALAILVLAAVGMPRLVRRLGRPLLLVAAAGLLLALLGRLPLVADLLREVIERYAVVGLLRDGQKWIAPTLLVLAIAAALGAEAALERVRAGSMQRLAGALAVLAPLAALPGAVWGESGRLQVSDYPADWSTVLARVDAPTVLVLPWSGYRRFPWTGDRTVLDPAPRWMDARAVVNDELPLPDRDLRGEDPVAQGLQEAARSGRPLVADLRRAGIGQVLVERSDRSADPAALERQVQGLDLVVANAELALYDVPGPTVDPDRAPVLPVVLGDLLALALVLWAATRNLPWVNGRRRAARSGAVDGNHVGGWRRGGA
jgi:hypothetical protein